MVADAASLPIGAVVLLSDGADNSGGVDLETISEIRRQRIPIHTIGFGREKMAHDVEITDVQVPARALARFAARQPSSVSISTATPDRKPSSPSKTAARFWRSRQSRLKADGVEQSRNTFFSTPERPA